MGEGVSVYTWACVDVFVHVCVCVHVSIESEKLDVS